MRGALLRFALCSLSVCVCFSASPRRAGGCTIVERLTPGGAGVKAGIQVGDTIEHWELAPHTSGSLATPFDLWEVELEQAPRGRVTLRGRSGRDSIQWTLPPGEWGIIVRPDLRGDALIAHDRASSLLKRGDVDGAVAAWESIAPLGVASVNPGLAYWVRRRCAAALLDARRFAQARGACEKAAEAARAMGSPRLEAQAIEGSARASERAGDWEGARGRWKEAAALREGAFGETLSLASALSSLAVAEWRLGADSGALTHHRRALAIRERFAPGSLPVASSLLNLSNLDRQRGEYGAAEEALLRALSIQERILPNGPDTVKSLNNLGFLAETRGRLDAAEGFYARALAIQERLDPRSPVAGTLLDNLGNVARIRSDFGAAEAYFRRALDLREALDPGGLDVAASRNNLGILFRVRGRLAEAQEHYAESMAIYERRAPASPDAATVTMNLGIVAMQRGDLAKAEEHCDKALVLRERLSPGGLPVAASRTTLGLLAWYRGDLDSAEEHFLCARDIYAQHAPSSLQEAMALNNLGLLYAESGRTDEAMICHTLALGIKQRLSPGGLDASASLLNLGQVAVLQGQLDIAEGYYGRALEMRDRLAPESLEVAECYSHLAFVRAEHKEWAAAEVLLRRALYIRERLAPESVREAETLHDLGLVLRDGGKPEEALDTLCRALASLEAQTLRLGGAESARESFSEKHGKIYRDYMDLLLKRGRTREAFGVSERSRARLLLEMLAARDLTLGGASSRELSTEAEQIEVDLARVHEELAGLGAAEGPARLGELEVRREALRRRREDLRGAIRRTDPRLGSLRCPETLDLEGAFSHLEPGALFLEYAVGERDTILFALGPTPGEYAAFTLPVGGPALRAEVGRFLAALRGREGVEALSTRLSAKLLDPVKDPIRRAQHILVSPDGCLHLIPFSALKDPGSKRFRYLAEAKPTGSTVSLTLHAELSQSRRAAPMAGGAAFGDPNYPEHLPASSGIARVAPSLLRNRKTGISFEALRFARIEVESVAASGMGPIQVWLGEDAKEEKVRSLPRETSLLHFACHAFADEEFPLDSALVLTIPGGATEPARDGLLQVWEIFESLRVDADLVALSACETALGKEVGGEGIIGLTRALHYAGARSVLSSLWSVPDQSTAELMRRFYVHLGAGAPKDEALRLAQVELIRGVDLGTEARAGLQQAAAHHFSHPRGSTPPDWSHPFYWAAFQLYGNAR